jgi:N utilization substance protein A
MNIEFFDALDSLEKEKGIPKDYMLEKVGLALASAYKRDQGTTNVRISIDDEKKEIRMFQQLTIVPDEEFTDEKTQIALEEALKANKKNMPGDIVEVELHPKNFRRLSAQTAKQVIIQAIREIERGKMIQEYEEKKEEIITATVHKIDPNNGDIVVDTGTSFAKLLKSEQIPHETFTENQQIKVFVTEVKKETSKGPIVTLSRIHPGLVKRLFELEVPELQDGTVVIMGIVREAGSRTKIAVMSRDENVDPTGSCIGPKSMRISKIVEELRGEKIDIIKYSDDLTTYIKAALAPAGVRNVIMEGDHISKVYVDNDQLSLAIGKEGQNVRLAAHLTGCKIDIKNI